MQFDNKFEVASPIDTVWGTLLDVEQVAPCMPGAEVLEQTGDKSYKVQIKVRLGPVSMQYRGEVEIVDADDSAHQARMVAKATEARGQGTANAEILMKLAEQDGKTQATLTTDLRLSGRAAAMGQGIVKDVASKLTDTFAECLQKKLAGEPAAEAEPDTAAEAASAATKPHEVAKPGEGQEPERDVTSVLEREDVEAATGGFTTPDRSDALKTQPDIPSEPPEKEPAAASEAQAELPALEIAASVAADRLRRPRTLLGAVAAVLLLGFAIGRIGRG
jgi:carbon monoxide dehydrogenase subunit G